MNEPSRDNPAYWFDEHAQEYEDEEGLSPFERFVIWIPLIMLASPFLWAYHRISDFVERRRKRGNHTSG